MLTNGCAVSADDITVGIVLTFPEYVQYRVPYWMNFFRQIILACCRVTDRGVICSMRAMFVVRRLLSWHLGCHLMQMSKEYKQHGNWISLAGTELRH